MTDKCPACGKPWIKHDGIVRTCQQLQVAIRTIRTIRTLAACSVSGLGQDIVRLCDETLKEVE
jgi:hypothetical protein